MLDKFVLTNRRYVLSRSVRLDEHGAPWWSTCFGLVVLSGRYAMIDLSLNDDEKRKVDAEVNDLARDEAKVEAEERRIRSEFEARYGKVAAGFLRSRFRVVRDFATNLTCLYEMLVDPDYTIPWTAKASIIFALGYFISPIDAIPDALPVVGYLDDALVVAYIVHHLSREIAAFRQWRRDQGRPLPSA